MEPELAVVVLSVGAPPELRLAIDSLLRQPEPLEIVVVNSGGGKLSGLVPDGQGIRSIEIPELLWPGAARNVGIRATRARWVAFLASDLIAAHDWAAERLALHRAGKSAVASAVGNSQTRNIFAWAAHVTLHARRMAGLPKRKAHRYGASYERSLFDRYGLFREDLRIGEDTEFHRRMRRRDRPVWAPKVVAAHRYPQTWRDLIAEHKVRGERWAVHWPTPQRGTWFGRGLKRFAGTLPLALRASRGRDRLMVLAASPVVLAACLAYEAGASSAGAHKAATRRYTVAVAILDRDDWSANTDVIVLVDPVMRHLTWVPRDLWVPGLDDRLNAAFARGGGALLIEALAEVRLPVEGLLCLRRAATEAALAGVEATVPVSEPMDFWYPLTPTQPIEAGRKQISFRPPSERLSGERLHQWIGARTRVSGAGSDLQRIERQQVLVQALLADGFDFAATLADRGLFRTTGRDPIPILSMVRRDWSCCLFDSVSDATINGKAVLIRS
ncbi:glycosyltransferase [Devosia sp. A16]|uniref:glycosyltransferase n=1 Tax=Devosia sp. A16 TaxID=1736675 RepID=UPI0006D765DD|nr:glycosyltransferase [Devosia sp. A16]